jgi:hypothetical protein
VVSNADGPRKIARLQIKKQMEIVSPVAITKLKLIPKLVNGRIELHWEGLPEGTAILHTLQVTDSVTIDPLP